MFLQKLRISVIGDKSGRKPNNIFIYVYVYYKGYSNYLSIKSWRKNRIYVQNEGIQLDIITSIFSHSQI